MPTFDEMYARKYVKHEITLPLLSQRFYRRFYKKCTNDCKKDAKKSAKEKNTQNSVQYMNFSSNFQFFHRYGSACRKNAKCATTQPGR
jgi:hypothetical protein